MSSPTTKEIRLSLPRPHRGQTQVLASTARFRIHACGRRWGKTTIGLNRLTEPALQGWPVAWFAPNYKYLAETWRDFRRRLKPVTTSVNKTERRIEVVGGGSIEFWTLQDPDSGRSRKYKRVAIDEAAKARYLEPAWNEAIRATLTDWKGDADFYSTPKGRDFFWKLYTRGQDPLQPEYQSWQLPTVQNPWIDPSEVEAARLELPERIFRQEYLAEFLEDAGGVFRCVAEAIDRGRAMPEPRRPVGAYTLGLDLARLVDFTIITVLDPLGRQVYFERIQRMSWERQIAAAAAAAERYGATIVADATGLGDPVVEMLKKSWPKVVPYELNVASKPAIIDGLAMALEQGKIRLMDIPEQEAELVAYEYQMTRGRTWKTEAPEGMHDDTVIALALAYYGSQKHSKRTGGGIW